MGRGNKLRNKFLEILIFIFILYLFLTFFIVPIKELFLTAFRNSDGTFSFVHFKNIFNSKFGPIAIKNTFILGLSTVVFAGLVGIVLAFFLNYYKIFSEKLEGIIKSLVLIPFMIPGVIIVLSVLQIFGSMGVFPQLFKSLLGLKRATFFLSGLPGILFIHGITQYIYFYVNVSIALKNLDQGIIDAAKNLGSSKFYIFKDIILPHLKPALISSALLTFFSGISSFSAPYLLEGNYKVINTEIMLNKMNNKMEIAAAYVFILIAASMVAVVLHRIYDTSKVDEEKGVQRRGERITLKGTSKVIWSIIIALIVILIILPILAVIYMSFISTRSWMMDIFPHQFTLNNYKEAFSNGRMLAPLITSLKMALLSSLITVPLCIIGAFLSILSKGIIKKVTSIIFLLPMILPASTLGVILITAFDEKAPLIGGKVLLGTPHLLTIAYILLSTTIVFTTLRNEFLSFRIESYEAALIIGANKFQIAKDIFIPQVKNGIGYAFSLVFLRALGEYTASALLYTVTARPVSIAMVSALQDYNIGVSMVYGSVLIITSIVLLFLLGNRRKIEI